MKSTTEALMRWDWPKQKHLVENGEKGDCWRCCIAAILQLPAESVPHFLRDGESMYADTQRWLKAHGFAFIDVSDASFPQWYGDDANLPLICSGPTIRSKKMGQLHAVVMKGEELLYDPHPSEAGILAITRQYLILSRNLTMPPGMEIKPLQKREESPGH